MWVGVVWWNGGGVSVGGLGEELVWVGVVWWAGGGVSVGVYCCRHSIAVRMHSC